MSLPVSETESERDAMGRAARGDGTDGDAVGAPSGNGAGGDAVGAPSGNGTDGDAIAGRVAANRGF